MSENLNDHRAAACECGSVKFCILASGNIECAKCGIKTLWLWIYKDKKEVMKNGDS